MTDEMEWLRKNAKRLDPTGSFAENALVGFGKSIADTGRAFKQLAALAGFGDKEAIQAEIDDAKRLDAPLMDTWGGNIGNIAGQVGMAMLPGGAVKVAAKGAAAVPALASAAPTLAKAGQAMIAPTTIPGAAILGGAMGAAQPVASDESRMRNVMFGAGGGAAIPTAMGAYQVGKSVVAPFTSRGQERVAGRVIERFASDPAKVLGANAVELVPGSKPLLSEAVDDVGISQLVRTLKNNPDANGSGIAEQMVKNQGARVAALADLAGDAGKREFFEASRETAAKQLYDKAFSEIPDMTPWIKGKITQLKKRPSFERAWGKAQELALEEGLTLDPKNVTQTLHYTKLALDDMIGAAQGNEQRALRGTKDLLLELMESKDFAPSYREARDTFAQMSKPIDQMKIGQALYNKLQPALADFGASTRAKAATYAEAVRNIDDLAKSATGFRGARAENILTPEQLAMVNNIGRDLGRTARAEELGLAKGSPTLQNIVGQDLLKSVVGPFGVPDSWVVNNALANTLLRGTTFAYKVPERETLKKLGEAALDPEEAKRLLRLARQRGRLGLLGDAAAPYLVAPSAGLLNLNQ